VTGPTSWRCDECATAVTADGGLLAYRTQPQPPYAAGGFRILHASCRAPNDAELATVRLAACLDRDGLSLLLGFLSAGPGRCPEPGLTVDDIDEFVDLIRRLHVPFYEPARRRFGEPHVRRTLLRADRAGPYQSPALRRLLQASG
jgi:hypothetical protein